MPRTGWSQPRSMASCACMRRGATTNRWFRRRGRERVTDPSPWPSRPMASALRLGLMTPQMLWCFRRATSGNSMCLMPAKPHGNIAIVAWSRDGRQLYAGGKSGYPRVVRRWEDGGRGRYTDIKVSNNTIMQLLPLNDGSILFGTADPAFGVIDAQGHVKTLQGPGDLDFRDAVLRLSRDGKTAEVSAINPSRTFRFNLSKRTVELDPPSDTALAEPVTNTPGLSVSNWKNEYKPKVNGNQIHLQDSRKISKHRDRARR